jgi:hypothetical protein
MRKLVVCTLLYLFIYLFQSLFLSFLVRSLLPIHCRCSGLLSHLITLKDTSARGRNSLDEGSVRRKDLYLATQNTSDRHPCPRQYSNPQSQHASDRRLMPSTARSSGCSVTTKYYSDDLVKKNESS